MFSWSHGQNHKDSTLTILKAPKNWISELLPFPLSFAPSLTYEGFEDLRFSENWRDENSEGFWSYAFVWSLESDPQLTEEKLQSDMKAYYNGLMRTETTFALFLENSDEKEGTSYIGKIQTLDNFFTKEQMILHATVQYTYCQKMDRHLVLFNISSKGFGSKIWKKLQKVKVEIDCEKGI